MERLTERNNDPIILCPLIKALEDDNAYCQSQNCDCDNCKLGKQLTKLAEYEDAEEQGLLIRLPCKVGDDVWTIMCGMTGKHPALFRQEFTLSMFSHFGTAVFLTKEEAEAALAEMEG